MDTLALATALCSQQDEVTNVQKVQNPLQNEVVLEHSMSPAQGLRLGNLPAATYCIERGQTRLISL
jgi:hypothetical protein